MSTQQDTRAAGSLQLGVQKYLLFGYMVAGFIVAWLVHNTVEKFWGEGHDLPATVIGVVAGIATVTWGARSERIRTWANETVDELSKVSWPSRQETYNATVITLVSSIVSALVIFSLDWTWNTITEAVFR